MEEIKRTMTIHGYPISRRHGQDGGPSHKQNGRGVALSQKCRL